MASVKVKPEIDISFKPISHGLTLVQDLDVLNFHQIKSGEKFGSLSLDLADNHTMPFIVTDQDNNDLTSNYFEIIDNNVVAKSSFVPSMITQSTKAIRQDCLCYIMHPIDT